MKPKLGVPVTFVVIPICEIEILVVRNMDSYCRLCRLFHKTPVSGGPKRLTERSSKMCVVDLVRLGRGGGFEI